MLKILRNIIHHPLSPFKKKTLYSVGVVAAILAIGTYGMHVIEGWSYVDAFYFVSMIATTQGASNAPLTTTGKIFAALMAFISVGAVISALAFVFGPLFGTLIHVGVRHAQMEEAKLKNKIEKV